MIGLPGLILAGLALIGAAAILAGLGKSHDDPPDPELDFDKKIERAMQAHEARKRRAAARARLAELEQRYGEEKESGDDDGESGDEDEESGDGE